MASMKKIRIGVIGCGGISQMMHLPHLREMNDRFEVLGLSDVNQTTLNAVGDYYGIGPRFPDYRDLLATDIEAVMILTGGSHTGPSIDAARARKHIFVEKPLCYTLTEADAIGRAVDATGVTLQVGYMKRHDPAFRYAARAVAELGEPRYARVTVLHPASELYYQHHVFHPPLPSGPVATRATGKKMVEFFTSGQNAALVEEIIGSNAPPMQRVALGLMLGSLCHDVNALRGLLGEPASVSHTDIWNDGLAFSSMLRYPNGLRASLTWTYLAEMRDYNEEIAIFGDASRVRIVFPSPFLRNYATEVFVQGSDALPDRPESASWEKRVTVSYHEAFKEELVHFYQCVVEGKSPITNLADSRSDLVLIHKMARAYRP